MGLRADYTATCDGCGAVATSSVVLDKDTAGGLGWFDIWGPAIPPRWLQRRGEVPLFFHDMACLQGWLCRNGKQDEARSLETAVWIA